MNPSPFWSQPDNLTSPSCRHEWLGGADSNADDSGEDVRQLEDELRSTDAQLLQLQGTEHQQWQRMEAEEMEADSKLRWLQSELQLQVIGTIFFLFVLAGSSCAGNGIVLSICV